MFSFLLIVDIKILKKDFDWVSKTKLNNTINNII